MKTWWIIKASDGLHIWGSYHKPLAVCSIGPYWTEQEAKELLKKWVQKEVTKMTEQEYIDRGDLVTVCHTLNLLRQIEPRNSSVITPREYKQVMKILVGWQDHLYAVQMID